MLVNIVYYIILLRDMYKAGPSYPDTGDDWVVLPLPEGVGREEDWKGEYVDFARETMFCRYLQGDIVF